MTNRQLIRVTPEGEVTLIDNTFEDIRDGVGGTFDFAHTNPVVGAYVGDMSLLEGLAFNVVASMVIGYPVWGTAVITAAQPSPIGDTVAPGDGIVKAALAMGQVWRLCREIAAESQGQQLTWHAEPATVPGPQVYALTDEGFAEWLATGGFRKPPSDEPI